MLAVPRHWRPLRSQLCVELFCSGRCRAPESGASFAACGAAITGGDLQMVLGRLPGSKRTNGQVLSSCVRLAVLLGLFFHRYSRIGFSKFPCDLRVSTFALLVLLGNQLWTYRRAATAVRAAEEPVRLQFFRFRRGTESPSFSTFLFDHKVGPTRWTAGCPADSA